MTFSRTRVSTAVALLLLALGAMACSPGRRGGLKPMNGRIVVEGFGEEAEQWELGESRYWTGQARGRRLQVTNTPLGTGVSPIWFSGSLPRNFEVAVRARIDKEGLDGGWGVEFGAKGRKFAYSVLLYASGRFCVDRLFGLYPEFIHCIPSQPEVYAGEVTNVLSARVEGDTISVSVNDELIVSFRDDRYEPGELALAVAGAGTGVTFKDLVITSLD